MAARCSQSCAACRSSRLDSLSFATAANASHRSAYVSNNLAFERIDFGEVGLKNHQRAFKRGEQLGFAVPEAVHLAKLGERAALARHDAAGFVNPMLGELQA